jgi:Na+-transporting methylmalonyl-CoA/oxaloacetate decarboxylase gamma subunit
MELLMQGVVLLVIGMATVVAFLVLMIIAMNCSAGFCRKFSHLFPEESAPSTGPSGDATAAIAVALAAIKAKRG